MRWRDGVFSVVPRLEVRLGVVLREEETAPQFSELLLPVLTEPKEQLATASGILDLVRFRHHKTSLGVDAGQDGVLGPRDGVLALSSQQDIPGLQTVERLLGRLEVYERGEVVREVVSPSAAVLLLLNQAGGGGTRRPGVRLHLDEAS